MKKIKIGDLFQFKIENKFYYIQYVFDVPDIGPMIMVINQGFEEQGFDIDLLKCKKNYYCFFPIKLNLKRGVIEFVDSHPVQTDSIPELMREKKVEPSGKESWFIVDVNTWKRVHKDVLNSEERNLSTWGVWNYQLLSDRLASGWKLENW